MSDVLENFKSENAAQYDQRFAKLSPFKDALHLVGRLALQTLPEAAEVLVVGAGTGAELVYLAAEFPGWRFLALEPSEDMLDVCRAKVKDAGLLDRCKFHQGFVEELPDKEAYDGATCLLVSHFLTDLRQREAFFRDIFERLLPGGLLLNADLAHCGEDQDQAWSLWLRTIAHLGATPAQVEGYEESVKAGVSFLTDEEMKALLGRAGFTHSHHLFRTILINAWIAKK